MPLRKIMDLKGGSKPIKPCSDPEHNPPTHMVFEDGVWEHNCPGCGATTRFIVSRPFLSS